MQNDNFASTAPKPFVFVLMPFKPEFDDLYKFGIKGATADAGAFAERLDEQMFTEGMLDRICGQINKADVIVADMTGRNPNVFYEVGYAHALQKIVLLVTQHTDDIPFDLKHHQHIVYGGSIDTLKNELTRKLLWAIGESRRARLTVSAPTFEVSLFAHLVKERRLTDASTVIKAITRTRDFQLPLLIRNISSEMSPAVGYIYLATVASPTILPARYVTETRPSTESPFNLGVSIFASSNPPILSTHTVTVPRPLQPLYGPTEVDSDFGTQFRLDHIIPTLPPDALEELYLAFQLADGVNVGTTNFRLRLHSNVGVFEFPFTLELALQNPESIDRPSDIP